MSESNLNLDEASKQLDCLRETYNSVASSIDKMKEPTAQLTTLADALRTALTTLRCRNDETFATFLCEEMTPGLCKRLHKERSNNSTVSLSFYSLMRYFLVSKSSSRCD
jgi:hypothetical protein